MPGVIDSGRDGLLVPPGDPGAISAAVRRLWGDPAWAARVSHRAATVAREYTWDRVAAETSAFYESVLALGPPRRA
jgi:glycosyltransferase involved in cell wall biosynthesis